MTKAKNMKLPISEYQKRFFLEWALDPESSAYNVSMIYKICGNLNNSKLKLACEKFIDNHVVVHAKYNNNGTLCYNANLTIDDFYHKERMSPNENVNKKIQSVLKQPFNLTQGDVLRFYILEDASDSSINYFVILGHHIIADAISAEIISREIMNNYNLSSGIDELHNFSKSFVDAVKAEEIFIVNKDKLITKNFWREYIGDMPLSIDFPHNSMVKSVKSDAVFFELSSQDSLLLRNIARENRTTLFILLASLYGVVLSKYSNQKKLLMSYPINMRPNGYANVTGCFVNNVPLKIDLCKNKNLNELIKDLTLQRKLVKEHQWYSLTDIIHDQRKIKHEYNQDAFNIGFIEANLNVDCIKLNGLNISTYDVHNAGESVYLMALQFDPRVKDCIKFKLEYRDDQIEQSLVVTFINSFLDLIKNLNKQEILLDNYNVLSKLDYQKIVYDWNKTEKNYPENKTINQLFESQVAKTPENIAVIYEDTKLTYKQLNDKANQLANYIRKTYQIIGDDLIALCLDRSEYMLISILAILKSGAAYVPIDPSYPDERIKYILEDTNVNIVLTNDIYESRFNVMLDSRDCLSNMICTIDSLKLWKKLKKLSSENLVQQINNRNLAYVIYTSGTTGTPKGVMIEHINVVAFIDGFNNKLRTITGFEKFTSDVLSSTSYVFDIFVLEYLQPLMFGGSIELYDLLTSNNKRLIELKNYNVIQITPSKFELLIQKLSPDNININKKHNLTLLIGGEPFNPQLILKIQELEKIWPNITFNIVNVYGPTETTVWSLFKNLTKSNIDISIGTPLDNETAYILDSNLEPIPIGAIGELYIGGSGVARGYLNLPDLTKERFIVNSFATINDQRKNYSRLYKTGDLVRRLTDGNIDYIGRNDDQVKIRGYRIEIDEIEQTLSNIPGIKQSCVLVKEKITSEDKFQYIVGYYILEKNSKFLTEEFILSGLSKILPEYMIPSALVKVEKIPLTVNGKLDKNALPIPDFVSKDKYVAPNDELETEICTIWRDVLGVERVGITDDFFRIGGDSLLAIRLVSSINVKFQTQISVKDVFKYKTIVQLSEIIKSSVGSFKYQDYVITEGNVNANEEFALTNVQQAYLYGRLDNFEMGNTATHSYSELLFSEFDVSKFESALNKLINRHGALRTIFKDDAQYILSNVDTYKIIDHGKITKSKLESIRDSLSHKIYKVDQWPLFDYELSQYKGQYILHMSFDALIMDGTSISILFNELSKLYGAEDMSAVNLGEIKINFRDYVLKYTDVRSSQLYTDAKDYWLNKLDSYNFDAKLPMIVNPNSVKTPKFVRLSKTILPSKWKKIEDKAKQHNISPTSVVLYAYGQVLTRWSGYSNFCINLTLFNRLPLHEQVNDILGDFTVLELFNFKRDKSGSINSNLEHLHSELWEDIEHNLFDGIDFQRLIRKEINIAQNQSLSPVVLTSMLSNKAFDFSFGGYIGNGYSITQTSQVYLDNKAYETKDGFVAEWDYVEELFDPEFIQQMHESYCNLIEYLAESNWDSSLTELAISKQNQIVIEKANSHKQLEVDLNLVDICLANIKARANAIAVVDSNDSYTYEDIYKYSYNIANYLNDNKLSKANHLIGILSRKGYQQVVATVGIMQSGSAYLPLHVDWPIGRIDEVLSEGLVKDVLVAQSEFNTLIKGGEYESKYNWLIIEEFINYKPKSSRSKLPNVKPDDLAYVIFTSGSTGKPKGVSISHKGAVNTIVAINQKFNVNNSDKVLALSELSFDLSVYDIFGLLSAGGTIVFPEQDQTKEPCHWYSLIKEHNITLWNTVPQLAQLLIDYVNNSKQSLDNLKAVLMSGDWIPLKLPTQIKELNSKTIVMSLGGATEGSIWSIWHEITDIDQSWASIPYGQAMPNQKMYILNEFGEHCPVSTTGEIYIGGDGVAIGYWNDEEKTNNSFVQHDNLGRLYKTGDLGKWTKGSYIEFMGRKDNQVKLNGYRVELDEIASKLTKIDGIDKAIVTIQSNQLVAYLVSDELKNKDEKIDKLEFKFEQKSIRNDLLPTYQIKHSNIDEKSYCLRKSYRQFQQNSIDLSENILKDMIGFHIKNVYHIQNISKDSISSCLLLESIYKILNPISAIKLEDKILPKYLYPSGGSTYAVQCYLEVNGYNEDINDGLYYYEPVSHYLAKIIKSEEYGVINKKVCKLKFNLYKPAIEPIYGDMSLRLAWLELGHILALIEPQLISEGLNAKLTIIDKDCDDYHNLVEISIEKRNNLEDRIELNIIDYNQITDIDYLLKKGESFSDQRKHYLDLTQKNIFVQLSEFNQLIKSAQGLIVLNGLNESKDLIQSGYIAQILIDKLYEKNIGSCALGIIPYDGANYSIAIGEITTKQKASSETKVKAICLEVALNQHIEQYLPSYMLPHHYMLLDNIPLTVNGKLDKNALPIPDFVSKDKYVAPKDELEEEMCTIWRDVLGVERVGVTDDFFRIGGDSLLAIRLVSSINVKFRTQISVKDIFKHKTIVQLSEVIKSSVGSFKYQDYVITDGHVNVNEEFALTNVQQAYLYGRLDNFEMGNTATHSYSELLFSEFDVSKFERALNKLIDRHGALRTIFKNDAQYILPNVDTYKIIDHGKITKSKLESIRDSLSHKIYKVDQWPLFDYELSQYKGQYILHMSFDALIMDGTSISILFNELSQLYSAKYMNEVNLREIKINFRDYVLKYTDVRSSQLYTDAKDYWLNKLDSYNFDAKLPMIVNPNNVKIPKFVRLSKTILPSKWKKIEDKAKQHNISPTSVVLYAYGQVLTRWSGYSNFCINLTLFNRLPLHEQVNDILGDFTVLELFNFKRDKSGSINSNLENLHNELWEDIEYNLFDGIDFQRLIRKEIDIAQNQSLSPVVLTSMLSNKAFDFSFGGYIGNGYSITQTSQVYLDNKAYETKDGFVAEWDYVEELFDPEFIQQMHESYCNLIEYLAEADWDSSLIELPISKQDQAIIEQANSYKQLNVSSTLVDICLANIKARANAIAVLDSRGSYTYEDIYKYSYSIANYLNDNNLSKANHLIGILSIKGYQQVVATLGIMQSGSAYLPLHVDWPIGRIDEVLTEGLVKDVLVAQSEFNTLIKDSEYESKYNWLIIEEVINYKPKNSKSKLPNVKPDDLAYVIFTSGSTGKPKGVSISHKGAVNTIVAINQKFDINNTDKVLALSELSFDLSVYDIFGLLYAGGTIVFPEQDQTKEPCHWYSLIKEHNITLWNTVPQLAQLLIDYVNNSKQSLDNLKAVLMSGDWIPLKLPTQIKELNSKTIVMSLGGATEGSIWSIWHEITDIDQSWTSIPYGQAMPNQKMYILNEFGEHCPVSAMGEIYIGGDGVAVGYWNDEEKTNNSFVQHDDLGRLYKTGDLGRWTKDSNIEFMGRKDNQVKLNGYRVELDEIASKLTKIDGIDKAIVTIQSNQLVAYLVSNTLERNEEIYKSYLLKYLPYYMIPNYYVFLEYFPLTSNGKLDKNSLPNPQVSDENNYIEPITELEIEISKIWNSVLKIDKVGITDDFFRIGGDSILAIQVSHKMTELLNYNVKVADIFHHKTIQTLLKNVNISQDNIEWEF